MSDYNTLDDGTGNVSEVENKIDQIVVKSDGTKSKEELSHELDEKMIMLGVNPDAYNIVASNLDGYKENELGEMVGIAWFELRAVHKSSSFNPLEANIDG